MSTSKSVAIDRAFLSSTNAPTLRTSLLRQAHDTIVWRPDVALESAPLYIQESSQLMLKLDGENLRQREVNGVQAYMRSL